MRYKLAAIAVALVAVTAVVGVSAFTTGSVARSADVNVVNDDAGLIGLEDGTSGDLVDQNSSGALAINFSQGGADGVNTEAHFELGNPDDPTNQSAFNITNNDATAHDLTVSYTGVDSTGDGSAVDDDKQSIQFQIYDTSAEDETEPSPVDTVSEETSSNSVELNDVADGETHYVVIVVDTHNVGSGADLSGTLEVSA